MDKIAVIILNYKTWKETLEEVETVHKVCGVNYKNIIIVDNNSQNESVEKFKEDSSKGYKLLISKENCGYAAGNNIGLKYAFKQGYKYAWILNNDIIIEDKNVLNKMVDIFKKDDQIAVVNPDIYDPNGYMFNRDSKRPNIFDLTVGAVGYKKRGRAIVDLGGYGYVYRPQGCCMLLDLYKVQQIGYMDEKTFLYCEEIILAERLRKGGYKSANLLNARVIHNHSKTVKTYIQKKQLQKIKLKSFSYYLKNYRRYNQLEIKICCLFYRIKLLVLGE